jgi:division protein CdvB (Snf7/Vps24/ESCRT-III family)
MSQFAGGWEQKKKGPGFGERLRGSVGSAEPMKPRLDQANRQIQAVMSRLDGTIAKLRDKDANLFNKIVSSVQKRDSARASVYANELAELRKMNRMVTQSRLALEQINLRLATITELGDIVTTLAPATSIIGSLRQSLTTLVPEAENGMSEISSMLSGILVDAGSVSGASLNFGVANEDAERVLTEAAAVAESRMESSFPEIPAAAMNREGEMEEA